MLYHFQILKSTNFQINWFTCFNRAKMRAVTAFMKKAAGRQRKQTE
jgi:hypothetical protein